MLPKGYPTNIESEVAEWIQQQKRNLKRLSKRD